MSNRFNGFEYFCLSSVIFVLRRWHRCRRYRSDCHRRLISTFSIVDFAVPTRGVFGDFSFFFCFSFVVLLKSVFVIIGIHRYRYTFDYFIVCYIIDRSLHLLFCCLSEILPQLFGWIDSTTYLTVFQLIFIESFVRLFSVVRSFVCFACAHLRLVIEWSTLK